MKKIYHPMTQLLMQQADAMPGFSRQQLIADLTGGSDPENYLTYAEACREFGIGRSTIGKWVHDGRIHAYGMSKRLRRVRRSEVAAALYVEAR